MNNPGLVMAQAAAAAAQLAQEAFDKLGQAVAASMSRMGQSVTSTMGQVGQSIQGMADRLANAGGVVGISMGKMAAATTAASVGILAFVRAGLQGTTEGARLGFQMQLLSREIASVFLPAIDKAISLLSTLVNKFQDLSGAQQQAIFHWGGLVSGIVLFVTKINPVIGAITAITAAFSMLGDAAPGVLSAINEKIQVVIGFVSKLYEQWKPVVELVGNAMVTAFSGLGEVFGEVVSSISVLIESISTGLVDAIVALMPVFETLMSVVAKVFTFILDMIGKMIRGIGWILDKVKELIGIGPGGGGQPEDAPQAVMAAKADKPDKGRRSVTMQAGGLESLTATANRIQEGIMKTFDPQQAHNEDKELAVKQIEKLDQVVQAVRGVNVGVGA